MTGAVVPGTASADLCPREQSHYSLHLDSSVAFLQPDGKGELLDHPSILTGVILIDEATALASHSRVFCKSPSSHDEKRARQWKHHATELQQAKKTPQKRGFLPKGQSILHHAAHAAHAAHVGHCWCSRLIFNDFSHHTLSGDHQSCD